MWSGVQESNLHSEFRRLMSYPLNERQLCGTRSRTRTGTPIRREILSLLCLPFHHPGKLFCYNLFYYFKFTFVCFSVYYNKLYTFVKCLLCNILSFYQTACGVDKIRVLGPDFI